MPKTAMQETLDNLEKALNKKIALAEFGFEQDLKEHYDIIREAQRKKDDADWMIRVHQTKADKLRCELEDRKMELRYEYEKAVEAFLHSSEIPAGWEVVS